MNDEQYEDFNEFQAIAHTTAIYPKKHGLHYTALGLAGEAGEYAGKVSKVYRDEDAVLTPERRAQLIDELSDVLWFVAECATALCIPLGAVARHNTQKLASRKERGVLGGSGDSR